MLVIQSAFTEREIRARERERDLPRAERAAAACWRGTNTTRVAAVRVRVRVHVRACKCTGALSFACARVVRRLGHPARSLNSSARQALTGSTIWEFPHIPRPAGTF